MLNKGKNEHASVKNRKRGRREPGAFVNLNSICDCIIIISCPGTVAYSWSIQILKMTKEDDDWLLAILISKPDQIPSLHEDGQLINEEAIFAFSMHILLVYHTKRWKWFTLQISSPWNPPAINKLSRTASVLTWVWVNPSKRLPGCFYKQSCVSIEISVTIYNNIMKRELKKPKTR